MNYIEISSRSNEKIKYVAKLVSNTKERKNSGLFVCEGMRLCYDAAVSGYEIKEVYITNEALAKYRQKAQKLTENAANVFIITVEVADKLSDTVNSQGVFCVAEMKKKNECVVDRKGKYVALEGIQNPQNSGAIARTAEALGIDGIIVSGGCDIYNPKALRASMGSLLRISVIETDNLPELIADYGKAGMTTFVTVPDDTAADITKTDLSGGVIAVIGNEGNGVSQESEKAAKMRVTIKMRGKAESLNASAAAVITMWEMTR